MSPRAPWALLVALLAAIGYAAFAEGATRLPQESWLQLALLLIAILAAGAFAYGGGVRPAASPVAWAGVALLAAFAVWTGVSIVWSVTPDRSWMALNRAIAYLLCVVLGIAVGSSLPRAPERLARGLAILVVPVALYAFGGKTLPEALDHAGALTRLRAPFGYWNALALFCVMATFPMLRLAADPARAAWRRLAALGGVHLLLLVLGMTYSRGGILAFVVGMTVFTIFTTERMRTVFALWAAMLAAIVPLTIALTRPDLIINGVPAGRRADDALLVLIAYLVTLVLLCLIGRALIALERGGTFTPARGRRVGRVLAATTVVLLGLSLFNALLTGQLAAAAKSFTDREGQSLTDPNRLLSTNSGNRWTWWQEAAGAWSDKPVGGWGAGSFPVTHDLYRTQLLPVQQPHSVPLQFLAETGVVGLVLGMGGLLALLAAALARVRALEWRESGAPPARGYAAALLAIPCAWIAHSFYDWDWDIPAVTLPMLLALGVLAARPVRPGADPVLPRTSGAGLRGLGFGVGVLAILLAVVSAGLPALAQTRTASALAAVGEERVSDEALAEAAADAQIAADLNPLAVEPLFAAASIAERRRRLEEVRELLLRALERQPASVDGWFRLARVEGVLRLDRAGLVRASERALELDPLNPAAFALARRAQQALLSPAESATATGSPIPTRVPIPGGVPAPSGLPSFGPTGPSGPAGFTGPSGPSGPTGATGPSPFPTP